MNEATLETLFIVSPCYNDADAIAFSAPLMLKKLNALIRNGKVSAESKLLLIDDGSSDGTWETMVSLKDNNPGEIEIVRHNINLGETQAFLTGMREAAKKADIIITIDCDLQDDIEKIDEMLVKHAKGAEIVYGCRSERSIDTTFYRFCANSFYFIMMAFGSKIVPNSSNFRLITKAAVLKLQEKKNKGNFLPAEVPLLNLKSDRIYYRRQERKAGKSGYNYLSLIKLAVSSFKDYTLLFEITAIVASTVSIVAIQKRFNKNGKQ